MGREIRKVPKDWKHPRDKYGRLKPMFAEAYEDVINAWMQNHILWQKGEHPDQKLYPKDTAACKFFAEWSGDAPGIEFYNPNKWNEDQACCFQVYENVSEGTPMSPVFETLQAVEDWMVTSQGYSRAAAKEFCIDGYVATFSGHYKMESNKRVVSKGMPEKKKGRKL